MCRKCQKFRNDKTQSFVSFVSKLSSLSVQKTRSQFKNGRGSIGHKPFRTPLAVEGGLRPLYTRSVLREHSEHPAPARKQLLGFSQNKENFDFSHFGKSDIFDIFEQIHLFWTPQTRTKDSRRGGVTTKHATHWTLHAAVERAPRPL